VWTQARIKRVMKIASCFSPRVRMALESRTCPEKVGSVSPLFLPWLPRAQMIGADAAPALAYLGEVFIRFLTRRAWNWAAANDRPPPDSGLPRFCR